MNTATNNEPEFATPEERAAFWSPEARAARKLALAQAIEARRERAKRSHGPRAPKKPAFLR